MGLPASKPRWTVEQYLDMERVAMERHEFHDGEVLAMAGGSVKHARVGSNALLALGKRLEGRLCQPFNSDLKIAISQSNRFVYPDVSVICGEPVPDPRDKNAESASNPQLIVEVLSPGTERYDRTKKFELYRTLETFTEYLLISTEEPRIETFFRQEDGAWVFASWSGVEATIKLRSLGLSIPASEIYAGVKFDPPPPPPDIRERLANEGLL